MAPTSPLDRASVCAPNCPIHFHIHRPPPHIFTKYFQIIKVLFVFAVIGGCGVVVVLLLVLEMSFSGFVKVKFQKKIRINEIL